MSTEEYCFLSCNTVEPSFFLRCFGPFLGHGHPDDRGSRQLTFCKVEMLTPRPTPNMEGLVSSISFKTCPARASLPACTVESRRNLLTSWRNQIHSISSITKQQAVDSSNMLVNCCQTMQHHIPGDCILQSSYCENLKFQNVHRTCKNPASRLLL